MAMGYGQMLLFPFLIILSHFANIATAQVPDLVFSNCTYSTNYTTNSTYQRNLETVLSSLPSNTSNNYDFYNTSAGQDPDTVNAITLCSGDVSRDICASCISNATLKLREVCPNQMDAIGWYAFCMLRYSNAGIFYRVWEDDRLDGDTCCFCDDYNVSSIDEFNKALRSLMDGLQKEEAAGGSLRKYATGNIVGPDFLTIYGLMQCIPDLSVAQCHSCLSDATAKIPIDCEGTEGGRIVGSSCYLRYETSSFYNEIPAISLPSAPPPRSPPPLPLIRTFIIAAR